jgi:hypothetical protein
LALLYLLRAGLGGTHGGKGSDYANLKKVMAATSSTNDADLVC